MRQKRRERSQSFEPTLDAEEVAATFIADAATARRWRVAGVGPVSFKIGPLLRRPAWKLERCLSQLRRLEAMA